jgi:hypothetical protein
LCNRILNISEQLENKEKDDRDKEAEINVILNKFGGNIKEISYQEIGYPYHPEKLIKIKEIMNEIDHEIIKIYTKDQYERHNYKYTHYVIIKDEEIEKEIDEEIGAKLDGIGVKLIGKGYLVPMDNPLFLIKNKMEKSANLRC